LINEYGEADSEMLLLIAVGVLGTYVLSTEFRGMSEEMGERKISWSISLKDSEEERF